MTRQLSRAVPGSMKATFVDRRRDKAGARGRTAASFVDFCGCFSCKSTSTLATRLSIPTSALMLATCLAAEPCAAQDAAALSDAGTRAIEARRFGDARDAFTKAAAVRPRDVSICFGAGVAAFMLGHDDEAQTRFECALALKPGFVPAAIWLADLHYRAGRLAEAIAIYEAAQRHSPDAVHLQRQLEAWRKEQALQSTFLDVQTEHFVALFQVASHEPRARTILGQLENAYSRIGNTLGVYPARRITVVLYTREQYAHITGLAEWSAAAYDGRIRVPLGDVLETTEIDRVLSHEYVHALVAIAGGRTVPAWLNEGLASVLTGAVDIEAALATTDVRPPLSKLHASFAGFSTRSEADAAYASAARAVRRLIDRRGMAAVVDLLRDLGRGTPFARAFQHRIGMRYEDFASSTP